MIVTGPNVGTRDRDIRRVPRVNAIRIACPLRRKDLEAPHRKPVPAAVAYMEIRRIAQRNPVEHKVVTALQYQKPWIVLAATRTRFVRQISPCEVLAQQRFAPASVDHAFAHHRRIRHIGPAD